MSWKNLVLQLWLNIFSMNQPVVCFYQKQSLQGINQYLFGWVWLVVPLVKSDGKILWLSISLKRINPFFFSWRYSSREGSIWDYHFGLSVARCASFPIKLCYSWSRISLQGINSCQSINIWGNHFWWDIARCASCRIRCRII